MKISTILYLHLSVLIFTTGCKAPENCKLCDPPVNIEFNPIIALVNDAPVLYSTDIKVLKYHFSGLIAFRQMPDSSGIRIVFLTELGIRVMEFSYTKGTIKNTYCMDAIKRKSTVDFMASFAGFLLKQPICRKTCVSSIENKSNYFCKLKKGYAVYEYIDTLKDKTILFEGRKKSAKARYSNSYYLPDEINVNMKYRTFIQLKKVSNAFK